MEPFYCVNQFACTDYKWSSDSTCRGMLYTYYANKWKKDEDVLLKYLLAMHWCLTVKSQQKLKLMRLNYFVCVLWEDTTVSSLNLVQHLAFSLSNSIRNLEKDQNPIRFALLLCINGLKHGLGKHITAFTFLKYKLLQLRGSVSIYLMLFKTKLKLINEGSSFQTKEKNNTFNHFV